MSPTVLDSSLPAQPREAAQAAEPMTWGAHYAMCEPSNFTLGDAINPWMHGTINALQARHEWERLRSALESAGASVTVMESSPHNPDQVFMMNAGLVWGSRAVVSRFRFPQRQSEEPLGRAWFTSQGFEVVEPEGDLRFEAGDAFELNGNLVAGWGYRSDEGAWERVATSLGVKATVARLIDPRFYHFDTCFAPLGQTQLWYPGAFDAAGQATLHAACPDLIALSEEEALAFTANCVRVGNTVLMPACSRRVEELLAERGLTALVVPTPEFIKSGGAARCLTLPLDTGTARS